MKDQFKYDVAISFAEEDRCVALCIALALELEGFKNVYYYPDNKSAGWGRELPGNLTEIYTRQARYAIVLFSGHYVSPGKTFTAVELNAIETRVKRDPSHVYMLPVIVDAKGYEHIIGRKEHIKWEYNPKQIAKTLKELFGTVRKTADQKNDGTAIHNEGDFPVFLLNNNIKKFIQNPIVNNGNK